ncbi:mechanosensitive ion channel family protein [Altericroceibacterium xinjiangense]|uniref:mechanosensitive ion channel family protein n=1 Tax=Altericroceibacterium xinjiangense TaxID=762261 RepID=UPI000F7F99F8|nr:mechanosensitive ion channel domain-containing protein [Altericroceibacterium xinjiangense]
MTSRIAGLFPDAPGWLAPVIVALVSGALAIALALVVHRLLFDLLRRVARASDSDSDDIIVERIAKPARYVMIALALVLVARRTPALALLWDRLAGFVIPALLGWMILALLNALVRVMEQRADISNADNLATRRRRTRLSIFSRIISFVVVFVTIGLMLLSIPGVREVGVTLVASAGLAALAVGAAAQPALKSLIAGLQMALTEPISIDDVVIIDGEFGRVEDIRMTYVVVRLWDERRLVVPTSRFLDETVENWTRQSAQILGTVFLHLDPLARIDPIREEFERQIATQDLWDGRVQNLRVTETRLDAIEVRLLMSARDASSAFDLRCAIREGMLAWIRDNQPEAIARKRLETVSGDQLLPG